MASQTLNDGHAPRSRFSRALPIAVLIAIVAVLAPVISHYYVIFYLQSFSYGESSAIPYALEKLGSENAGIRAAAAHGLSMIGPKARQAVPQLLEALRNDNRDVASSAAVALGSIDGTSPEVIAALVAGLDHDDWQVRSYCANAIDEIGPRAWTAIPKLRELVSDPRMGWVAVRTLGELNARIAIPEITAFLGNSESRAQAEGIDALGKLQPLPQGTIKELERLRNDEDEVVRDAARRVLGVKSSVDLSGEKE